VYYLLVAVVVVFLQLLCFFPLFFFHYLPFLMGKFGNVGFPFFDKRRSILMGIAAMVLQFRLNLLYANFTIYILTLYNLLHHFFVFIRTTQYCTFCIFSFLIISLTLSDYDGDGDRDHHLRLFFLGQ